MGNWPVATWCFCLALPLIISNVELCKLRSRLAVSDVAWTWVCYVSMEISSYVHAVPGLRKVLETFVACIIFAFLSNTSLSLHQPALEWPLLHLLLPSSRGQAAEAG
ncbi:hypothetical protein R6Z07M_015482 [Ovis aries]